jgi:hypothetical protein
MKKTMMKRKRRRRKTKKKNQIWNHLHLGGQEVGPRSLSTVKHQTDNSWMAPTRAPCTRLKEKLFVHLHGGAKSYP